LTNHQPIWRPIQAVLVRAFEQQFENALCDLDRAANQRCIRLGLTAWQHQPMAACRDSHHDILGEAHALGYRIIVRIQCRNQ
jgi:hypothetical protein